MTPTEIHIDALMEKIEKLEAENARYREALEFYAKHETWTLSSSLGNTRSLYKIKQYNDGLEDMELFKNYCDDPFVYKGKLDYTIAGRKAREALKGE